MNVDKFKTNGIKQARVHKWLLSHFDMVNGDSKALIDCSIADFLRDLWLAHQSDYAKTDSEKDSVAIGVLQQRLFQLFNTSF